MSDEYTIDAKYKRDNLVAEHERYREALRQIAEGDLWEDAGTPETGVAYVDGKARLLRYRRVVTPAQRAREALRVRERGEM